jgi:aspartyl-tRNA(Asn)/glutamyl-tRNA(Gln) amidotransferase subunit A
MTLPWTVAELAHAVRTKECSAASVTAEALRRINASNARLGTFLTVNEESAGRRAEEIDRAIECGVDPGPLAGVPIAVKDNICTRGTPTTCGSRMLESFRSLYDAHVVDRLNAAGAVIIGKTNLDEFAMGSSCENSAFFPTRNPWDPGRVAGGSSGGSAAAVAARLVPAALGSDTGGSIRLPASFCGVTGLKPTYGRVSRYGLVAFGSSLDQIGPITVSAKDAALVLSAIAGHDARDSTSVRTPVPDYAAGLDQPLKGLRLGVSAEYFGDGLSESVHRAVTDAIARLKDYGALVSEVALPHMHHAVACYYVIASSEASGNLARFDGVHYGLRAERPADIFDLYIASRGQGLGTEVKRRIMLGTFALSSGYYDAYYLTALKVRTLVKQDFERAFQSVDIIVAPTAPFTAFALGEKSENPLAMYLSDIYTISANLAGLCALSVPCGYDDAGMPIGLQLMGPAFGEGTVLSAAHHFQRCTDFHSRTPPESPESAIG